MSATSTMLSAVLETDSSIFASFNRGPITSVFSPPSSCLGTLTLDQSSKQDLYWGHLGRSYYYDPACYPTPTVPAQSLVGGPWDTYYYSPAICPQGWSRATTFTDSTFPGPLKDTLLSVGSDTTVALCCPSGYSYRGQDGAGHQCTSKITQDQILAYVLPTSLGNSVDRGSVSMTTIPSDSTVNGDGVPILWQSSDSAVLAAASTMTPTQSSTTLTTSAQTSPTSSIAPPTSTPQSSGLSTGTKAGIGVGVPLAVVAIAAIAFLLFRRRRKNTAIANGSEARGDLDAYEPKRGGPTEIYAEHREPQELYTQPEPYHSRHELQQSGYR